MYSQSFLWLLNNFFCNVNNPLFWFISGFVEKFEGFLTNLPYRFVVIFIFKQYRYFKLGIFNLLQISTIVDLKMS